MERRVLLRASLAAAWIPLLPWSAWPTAAIARATIRRTEIQSLYLSIVNDLRRNRQESALRRSLDLVRYSNEDPNWMTYPESFAISSVRYGLSHSLPKEERLEAARGVFASFPGAQGDMSTTYQTLAYATSELLKEEVEFGDQVDGYQAEYASHLVLFAALAPGKYRRQMATAAFQAIERYNVSLIESWEDGGMSLRLTAVSTGLGGDWQKSAALFDRILADPRSEIERDIDIAGPVRGFAAFHNGRESLEAEAATSYCLAGRLDDSIAAFEESRRRTPIYKRNQGAGGKSAHDLERAIVASGTVLVNLSLTFAGALAILSRYEDNHVYRAYAFDSESGGTALFSVINKTGPEDPNGLFKVYRTARAKDGAQQRIAISDYVGVASDAAAKLVGKVLAKILRDEGVGRDDDVLVIVPAGIASLPVSLLQGPSGEVLCQRYKIRFSDSLASSASAQATVSQIAGHGKRIALMTVYPSEGGPLYANAEAAAVESVSTTYGLSTFKVSLRRHLRWPSEHAYWHITAHAEGNTENPKEAGIKLGKRGLVSIEDTLSIRWKRPPRLVFLSACETALINTQESLDEFLSLPTAFLALGAGGVIASQWPVSDAASTLLSIKFYQLHFDRKYEPSEALRQAQEWLRGATKAELLQVISTLASESDAFIDQSSELFRFIQTRNSLTVFADPYYWGGFQLYGA